MENGGSTRKLTPRGRERRRQLLDHAARRFAEGELIERNVVLVIPADEWPAVQHTIISRYCFSWGARADAAAIPLGTCSFLNHSYTPNAMAQQSLGEGIIEFLALRDIEPDEEVTLNYNGDPGATDPMSFRVRR